MSTLHSAVDLSEPFISEHPPSERPPDEASRWCGPLFIVGMPRSGTKLLRGLLGQHPRIRIPDTETGFFPFLVRWVQEHGEPGAEHSFSVLFDALRRSTYFALRENSHPFLWRQWRSCCAGRFDAGGLFEGFIRYETGLAPDSGVIWGDKSPAYVRQIDALLSHYPQARVIHIVRDVRDYCASVRKAWSKDVRRAAFIWGRDVAAAHAICEANAERCIETSYEDLLRDPAVALRRLAAFLDVDYIDAMTRLSRSVESVGEAAGQMDIVRSNFNKFAQRLTRAEIEAIEALSVTTMRLMRYEPLYAQRQKQLDKFEQRWLQIKDGLNLLKRDARRRGVLRALRFHASHARMTH